MQYSNTGYLLNTAIIEKVSGIQFLQECIFKPIQLKNTGVYNGRTVVKNLATGHSVWKEVIQTEFVDMSIPQGAYGLYSTAEDLCKWAMSLKDGTLLGEQLQKKIFTSYLGGYGYGWFIGDSSRQASIRVILMALQAS